MNNRKIGHAKGFSTQSFSLEGAKLEKTDKKTILTPNNTGLSKPIAVDVNYWLAQAAECYNISKKLEDYLITPVIAVISDLPNTNGDAFSKRELLAFNPDAGMLAYQTFKGKPCHHEHNNKDHSIAKGVILDVDIMPLRTHSGNHVKLIHLAAFDRTRDPKLCNEISSGRLNTYSMGAYYDSYKCSICDNRVGKDGANTSCSHTQLRKPTYMDPVTRQLAFRFCEKVNGFEISLVSDPAFISAISDHHL